MRQNVRNRRYQRYKALKLYLAKLNPKFEAFFQNTRKNWSVEDNAWYEARPVVVIKKCEDKIHFFSWKFNFWLLINYCQNIYFTLKGWICKVLTRKARIFIGTTSVWRTFGKPSALEYKSWGVWNSWLRFLGLALYHTPPKASKNCLDSFCVKKKKSFLFFFCPWDIVSGVLRGRLGIYGSSICDSTLKAKLGSPTPIFRKKDGS